MARAMLLHASAHWKHGIDSTMWPMAVFDDLFTTVASVERENDPPSHWNDLCLEQTEFIPIDIPVPLSHEWLSETDTTQEK